MPVQERDYLTAPEPAAPAGWLQRLNEFGERHAKAIITVSTALIILTVLLFAKYFYDQAMQERAERDLISADTIEDFKKFKETYKGYPVQAKFIYRLANRYNDEHQLEAARNEYQEFLSKFREHALAFQVQEALHRLEANLKFEEEQKARRLKEFVLQSHPRQFADLKDPRLQWGPVHEPLPEAEIETSGGIVRVELYEDEAPNAVANFVKLCEQKYFDGVKVDLVNSDERLATLPKAEGAPAYALAVETGARVAGEGSLVLVRKEGAEENLAGGFQILLKPVPGLSGVTVLGAVTDGLPRLKAMKKDDAFKSVKVTRKRDHPYEPTPLKKP